MLNIPDDYEPYRMNCLAGETTASHAVDPMAGDRLARQHEQVRHGVCPACGRDMKEERTGVFTCNAGHLLIVMTNSQATQAHMGRPHRSRSHHAKPAQKRIMRPRKNKASCHLSSAHAQKRSKLTSAQKSAKR